MLTGEPRIEFPGPGTMTPAQEKVFANVVNGPRGMLIGPLRAAMHNPELAERWQQLGETLRYHTVFPGEYSELAILVTARRWNSELEWTIHSKAALRAGLSAEIVEAIREGRLPEFEKPAQREIYDFVAGLQNHGQVPDAVHAAIVARWDVIGAVELTALTGYYSMVALTLNAHRIPLPEGEAPTLHPGTADLPQTLHEIPMLRQNGR
jgi:4-carboxymuconolactone decarboxylase